MDRQRELEILLAAIHNAPPLEYSDDEVEALRVKLQNELDATPKRWPCQGLEDKAELGIYLSAESDRTVLIRCVDAIDNAVCNLSDPNAIDFGMACVKAGGGDVLDKAAVIRRLVHIAEGHDTGEDLALYLDELEAGKPSPVVMLPSAALKALLDQIDNNDYTDSADHELKKNIVVHSAREALQGISA